MPIPVRRFLSLALASGLFLSYIPVALCHRLKSLGIRAPRWTGAGLVGTLWGVGTWALLPEGGSILALCLLTGAVGAAWVSRQAQQYLETHDDPRIVVDELVGYWFAVAFLPQGWQILLSAFVLFRILDVWKPSLYRWTQNLPGGIGIVADDIAAGILTNLILRLVLCAI